MNEFLLGLRRSLTFLGLGSPPVPDLLDVGMPAPAFTLTDENRVAHHLSDYSGRWLALYFYPKDGTIGCVMEARGFRDEIERFRERDVRVVGISVDDADRHRQFIDRHDLPFTLLSDPGGRVAGRYGARVGLLGKVYARRQTFLIDPEGVIRHMWRTVSPRGHAEDVLAVLDALR